MFFTLGEYLTSSEAVREPILFLETLIEVKFI